MSRNTSQRPRIVADVDADLLQRFHARVVADGTTMREQFCAAFEAAQRDQARLVALIADAAAQARAERRKRLTIDAEPEQVLSIKTVAFENDVTIGALAQALIANFCAQK